VDCELRAAGWLIGSHGHTHRFLNRLSVNELDDELTRSRDVLGALFGSAPSHLAFPGGRTSRRVELQARAVGFSTLWSSRPGLNACRLTQEPLRRTAVRRGMGRQLFGRLICGDALAHGVDELRDEALSVARNALGEERYHQLAGSILRTLRRR
jgi:peptidoglycan/xylan/chitin deacetylase (PgdA/CDA1 family)